MHLWLEPAISGLRPSSQRLRIGNGIEYNN